VHRDPETHEFRRHTLLNGLDEIALTLQNEERISAFEAKRPGWLTQTGE
jgi:3-isopropylmalate/(R)-2-methylmalate dehydratase small subunit